MSAAASETLPAHQRSGFCIVLESTPLGPGGRIWFGFGSWHDESVRELEIRRSVVPSGTKPSAACWIRIQPQ